MCSIPGGRGEHGRHGQIDRLGRAIDELAEAARAGDASARDVATRLAEVWAMVAELDPELARRLAGYST
jgi:hypothetical protein